MNNREAERSARGGSTRIEGFLRLWGRRLLVNVGIQAALSARRKAVALQAAGPVWDDVTHGRAADNRAAAAAA